MSITVSDITITSRVCVVEDEAHICMQVTTPNGLVRFERSMFDPKEIPATLPDHEADLLNLALVHNIVHEIDQDPAWVQQWNELLQPDLVNLYFLVKASGTLALCKALNEHQREVNAILTRLGVLT